MATTKKTRKVNPKSDFSKELKKVRTLIPTNTLEIEIKPFDEHFKTRKTSKGKTFTVNEAVRYICDASEDLRQIRNTALGMVMKRHTQMTRTKKYRRLMKNYGVLSEQISKVEKRKVSDKNKELLQELKAERKLISEVLEDLKIEYSITKSYVTETTQMLKDTVFINVDSVLALKCADRVWLTMENLIFGNAESVNYLKNGHLPSLEAKQSNRCLILKQDKDRKLYLSFNGFKFNLCVKKNDLYVQETLSYIKEYMNRGAKIDESNVDMFKGGLGALSTYRILHNRIVVKRIRGRVRLYLQIVYEGQTVHRRKKDGSLRHKYGEGRVAHDVGTQSVAVVAKDKVDLKNLAERSRTTLNFERKIRIIDRAMDRSKRATNPEFFNENGTAKRRRDVKKDVKWRTSKNYLKLRNKRAEMHRKAALSREYAINEDVNKYRAWGDECIVENMNISALQKKAKETTVNEKTGKFNRKKRSGKSIGKRCPSGYISQLKRRFEATGGTFKEVNTWTFKASQYDHKLQDCNKKQLSQRWHKFEDGDKIQRDLYSGMLLYCSDNDFSKPNPEMCEEFFNKFKSMHDECVNNIKINRINVLNSGIKINI